MTAASQKYPLLTLPMQKVLIEDDVLFLGQIFATDSEAFSKSMPDLCLALGDMSTSDLSTSEKEQKRPLLVGLCTAIYTKFREDASIVVNNIESVTKLLDRWISYDMDDQEFFFSELACNIWRVFGLKPKSFLLKPVWPLYLKYLKKNNTNLLTILCTILIHLDFYYPIGLDSSMNELIDLVLHQPKVQNVKHAIINTIGKGYSKNSEIVEQKLPDLIKDFQKSSQNIQLSYYNLFIKIAKKNPKIFHPELDKFENISPGICVPLSLYFLYDIAIEMPTIIIPFVEKVMFIFDSASEQTVHIVCHLLILIGAVDLNLARLQIKNLLHMEKRLKDPLPVFKSIEIITDKVSNAATDYLLELQEYKTNPSCTSEILTIIKNIEEANASQPTKIKRNSSSRPQFKNAKNNTGIVKSRSFCREPTILPEPASSGSLKNPTSLNSIKPILPATSPTVLATTDDNKGGTAFSTTSESFNSSSASLTPITTPAISSPSTPTVEAKAPSTAALTTTTTAPSSANVTVSPSQQPSKRKSISSKAPLQKSNTTGGASKIMTKLSSSFSFSSKSNVSIAPPQKVRTASVVSETSLNVRKNGLKANSDPNTVAFSTISLNKDENDKSSNEVSNPGTTEELVPPTPNGASSQNSTRKSNSITNLAGVSTPKLIDGSISKEAQNNSHDGRINDHAAAHDIILDGNLIYKSGRLSRSQVHCVLSINYLKVNKIKDGKNMKTIDTSEIHVATALSEKEFIVVYGSKRKKIFFTSKDGQISEWVNEITHLCS